MLCDICGKKQATVHLTEIIDDQMTELHLCEGCAKEKGAQMEKHFGLSDLLAGLADLGAEQIEPVAQGAIKCPNCGITFADFRRTGRLGCSECYGAFKRSLLPLLKRIHGSTQHLGKAPAYSSAMPAAKNKPSVLQQLQQLKSSLQRCIQLEEFEEAANIRDKIKELEKKGRR